MYLTFWGGARTVTGSSFLFEGNGCKVLVDCGMFQGGKALRQLNEMDFPFHPGEIDYVLLTHAHIDHSGLIPKLYKGGFKGEVLASKPTVDLCQIMLPDSGYIQEVENEWVNRKRTRAGLPSIPPLYTSDDARACLELFQPVECDEEIVLTPEFTVRFKTAGHILGAAIVEVWINRDGDKKKIVFSGDLGNRSRPIVKDPDYIEEADMVVVESTYGNRVHEQQRETYEKLKQIIIKTVEKKGNVIIPAFAVGRTQEIIYALNDMVNKGEIPPIPVYLDSPMAISATKVFEQNTQYYDQEAQQHLLEGDNPLHFPTLTFTHTAEESKRLNEEAKGCVIISASGMADAGRIKHHLKHNLWKPESSVVFVGYQAQGSLGRRILEGENKVRIFGEDIMVRAEIHSLQGLSAHADQNGIIDWLSQFKTPIQRVFLVHGEDEGIANLKKRIENELSLSVVAPDRGEQFELLGSSLEGVVPAKKDRYDQLSNWQLEETLYEQLENIENHYFQLRENMLQLAVNPGQREQLLTAIRTLTELGETIRKL